MHDEHAREMSPAIALPGLSHGAATHPGLVREINEDRYLVAPESGVFAVADGMGGHHAGDRASAALVESLATVGTAVTPNDLRARLEDRVLRAHMAIQTLGAESGRIVGSVVAVLLVFGHDFACLWSGDSRIYLIRGGRIAQLTRDHTEVQELLDNAVLTPEEAQAWPRQNVITRAVGVHDRPELDFHAGTIEPGDVFVICSDGLTAHADDADILRLAAGREAQGASDALLALALERGGRDNVTVVVVRFAAAPAAGGREERPA